MFNILKSLPLTFVVLASLCSSTFAAGSGAFRLEVPDAAAAGKGSAFTAEANTPAAVYYNPAGMTQMETAAVSLGASVIQPFVDHTSSAGVESQMRRGTYTIPHMFFVAPVGERFAFGIGALSSWGLTTYWHQDSFARYNATRSSVENKDYLVSMAYDLNEQFSIGLSLDIDDSKVDKSKKLDQSNVFAADGDFRLKGESTGYGFRIAGIYKPNENHQFGVMYRSPIQHKYKGKIYMDNLSPLGYGSAVYFNGTSYETEVISKMLLPDSVVVGYSFKPNEKWTFNADVEYMNWTVVNEEELAYPNETNANRLAVLNNGNPASRDWLSVISAAVGMQYNVSDAFRLRTGYYYHQSPVPENNWEANLPDSDSHGVTLGFGYDFTDAFTLDLSWSGIAYKKRVIDNAVASGTINGTYRQFINLLYLTATYKF